MDVARTAKNLTLLGLASIVAYAVFQFHRTSTFLAQIDDTQLDRAVATNRQIILVDRSGSEFHRWSDSGSVRIGFERIPATVVKAFLAAEDDRFYQHHGFDLMAIGRSIVANLRAGQASQGGSTITQQLARSLFLTREKTFDRKFKELLLAVVMESTLSKNDILELYLNHIYLGLSRPGIVTAARYYFEKSVERLTVAEAALLAGLARAPARLSPFKNLEAARQRRHQVLTRMHHLGFIDSAVWSDATTTKLPRNPPSYFRHDPVAFAAALVRRHFTRNFANMQQRFPRLYIHTFIDRDAQVALAKTLRASVPLRERDGKIEAAALILDPSEQSVVAVQGSRLYSDSSFDRAFYSRRPIGHMTTPFYLAKALDSGYQLSDSVRLDLNNPHEPLSQARHPTLLDLLSTPNASELKWLRAHLGARSLAAYFRALRVADGRSASRVADLGSGQASVWQFAGAYGAILFGQPPLARPLVIAKITDDQQRVLWRATRRPAANLVSDQTTYALRYALSMASSESGGASGWQGTEKASHGVSYVQSDRGRKNVHLIAVHDRWLLAGWIGTERGIGRVGSDRREAVGLARRFLHDMWHLAPVKSVRLSIPPGIGFERVPGRLGRATRSVPRIIRPL